MADELDDILRTGLQSEMVGWAPGAPVEITRVHLAGRIRARRRNQAVGAVVAASAAALVWSLPHTGAATSPPGQPDALQIAPAPTSTEPVPPASPPGTASPAPPTSRAMPGSPGVTSARQRPPTPPGTPRSVPSPTSAPGQAAAAPTTPPPPTTPAPPTTPEPGTTLPVPTTVAGPGGTDTTLPLISVPGATTTVPTTPTGALVLTNSALGGTVSVTVGTTIELELSGCPGTVWTPVTSPAQAVVRVTAFDTSPATGAATAELRAAAAGRVTLHLRMSSTCTTSLGGVGLTIVVH